MTVSRIYRELSSKEIEKAVTGLFGSSSVVTDSRLLKGGMFNTTYLIESNGYHTPLVLRAAPVNKHLLFDFEKDMMSAESMLHDLLQENGIPTTKIVAYSEEGGIIGREFIVMEYMDTVVMNDPSLAEVNLDHIYEEIGRITKRLHEIKRERFGWPRKSGWGEYDTWFDFIIRFSSEIKERSLEYDIFGRDVLDDFTGVIYENKHVFNRIKDPYMAHRDLWQGNILLDKKNGDLGVAAIIDLDRTVFGDTAFDLSSPWIANEHFYKGYGQEYDDGTLAHRKNLYNLILNLFEAYIWHVEYDDEERSSLHRNEAARQLKEIVC